MSDDLVERVAHELTGYIGSTCCHKTGGRSADPRCECRLLARAAIAVALEEAAKVCDEYSASEMKFFNEEGGLAALGRANAAEDLAASIRALKEKK